METDNTHDHNGQELQSLLNRYYRGETTIAEERRLTALLMQGDDRSLSPEAKATKATRMYYAVRPPRRTAMRWRIVATAAASVALVAGIGWSLLRSPGIPMPDKSPIQAAADGSECIAYVNGHIVDDDEAVLAIFADDMRLMEEVSEEIGLSVSDDLEMFDIEDDDI